MDDVQRAYHCAPAAPNVLHFGTVFAIAAQEAKLEHVVMLGQWLSHKDHPSVATREVWLNEEVLRLPGRSGRHAAHRPSPDAYR